MIRCEYADAFNFSKIPSLIDETESNLTEDVEIDAEQLTIDTFLFEWNDFDTEKVYVISEILSHILIQECGKIPNERFQFTLESKKIINVTDIIYEILHQNGNPMTPDDIFTELNKIYPNRYKSSDRVRTLVASDPRICMIGKASLVGLLEWKHIKIGSIRDIIVQYLSSLMTHNRPLKLWNMFNNIETPQKVAYAPQWEVVISLFNSVVAYTV